MLSLGTMQDVLYFEQALFNWYSVCLFQALAYLGNKMSTVLIYCSSFLTVLMSCFFLCSSLELYQEFAEEPYCVSLHPNGQSILVSFLSKLCLMHVLVHKFRTVQEFAIGNCSEVSPH